MKHQNEKISSQRSSVSQGPSKENQEAINLSLIAQSNGQNSSAQLNILNKDEQLKKKQKKVSKTQSFHKSNQMKQIINKENNFNEAQISEIQLNNQKFILVEPDSLEFSLSNKINIQNNLKNKRNIQEKMVQTAQMQLQSNQSIKKQSLQEIQKQQKDLIDKKILKSEKNEEMNIEETVLKEKKTDLFENQINKQSNCQKYQEQIIENNIEQLNKITKNHAFNIINSNINDNQKMNENQQINFQKNNLLVPINLNIAPGNQSGAQLSQQQQTNIVTASDVNDQSQTETEDFLVNQDMIDDQLKEGYESPKNQQKNNLIYKDGKRNVAHLNPEQFHESKITQVTGITNDVKQSCKSVVSQIDTAQSKVKQFEGKIKISDLKDQNIQNSHKSFKNELKNKNSLKFEQDDAEMSCDEKEIIENNDQKEHNEIIQILKTVSLDSNRRNFDNSAQTNGRLDGKISNDQKYLSKQKQVLSQNYQKKESKPSDFLEQLQKNQDFEIFPQSSKLNVIKNYNSQNKINNERINVTLQIQAQQIKKQMKSEQSADQNISQQSNIHEQFEQDDTSFSDMISDQEKQQMPNKYEKQNIPQSQNQHNIQKLIEEMTKKEEKWTKEQDEYLVKLVSVYKVENIQQVQKELNHFIELKMEELPSEQHHILCQLKTEIECMDRWLYLRNNTEDGTIKQIKGNWTPEEDMILKKKVAEYGLKKWKEIATFLPGRIGKQCRERWYNNVDPNLNKEKWTIAEDLQLMELHQQFGNKWVQIQKFMPGRIDNDIKNRFNASLRKYKTFEEYMEANDKKREKSKKKYYWRQHYELRNVNNSKRLPLNDQDKEFKNMAQQKIQFEVGSNLPPLKNDLIQEKKREMEEYKEFRKQKAKAREEKKKQKSKENMNRKNKSYNSQSGVQTSFVNHDENYDSQSMNNFDQDNIDMLNETQDNILNPFTTREKFLVQNSDKDLIALPKNETSEKILDQQKSCNIVEKKELNEQKSTKLKVSNQSYLQDEQLIDLLRKRTNESQILNNEKLNQDSQKQQKTEAQELNLNSKQLNGKISTYQQIFEIEKCEHDKKADKKINPFKVFVCEQKYRELFMPLKEPAVEDNLSESKLSSHQQSPKLIQKQDLKIASSAQKQIVDHQSIVEQQVQQNQDKNKTGDFLFNLRKMNQQIQQSKNPAVAQSKNSAFKPFKQAFQKNNHSLQKNQNEQNQINQGQQNKSQLIERNNQKQRINTIQNQSQDVQNAKVDDKQVQILRNQLLNKIQQQLSQIQSIKIQQEFREREAAKFFQNQQIHKRKQIIGSSQSKHLIAPSILGKRKLEEQTGSLKKQSSNFHSNKKIKLIQENVRTQKSQKKIA